MINLNFSFAIAIYLFLLLAVVFSFWVFSRKQKGKDLALDPAHIWFCSICTYTYINTKQDSISICPRCSSYNKK
ncbi:MAG: hypothetical protein NTY47_08590 [Candidatus Omnitrophica bacterium]|nr:hypothetical protein [Candidatus Omnitrophota bacterium]